MTKVEFLCDFIFQNKKYKKGDVVDFPEDEAKALIGVEVVKKARKEKPKIQPQMEKVLKADLTKGGQ